MQTIHHSVGPDDLFLQRQERLRNDALAAVAPKANEVLELLPSFAEDVLEVEQVLWREHAYSGKLLADGIDFGVRSLGFDDEFFGRKMLLLFEALADQLGELAKLYQILLLDV